MPATATATVTPDQLKTSEEAAHYYRSKLEAILHIASRATQGHDHDCTCATCLIWERTYDALYNRKAQG